MKSRFEKFRGGKKNVFSKNSRRTQRTTRKNIFLRSLHREAHYEQVQIFKYDFIKVKKMFFQITPVLCLLCCNRKRGCSLRKYFCRWKSTYNFFAIARQFYVVGSRTYKRTSFRHRYTGIFLVLYLYLDRYIFYELSIETHKPKNEETNKHGIYK